MELKKQRIVMTGGAGFIGSHLVDRLVEKGNKVVVVDNLSSGKMEFLKNSKKEIEFVKADLMKSGSLNSILDGCNLLIHLAANPQVKIKENETRVHIDHNIMLTYLVLEAMRKKRVPNMIFASTSTVYGEPNLIPTPEDFGPLIPISLYGASKLACEALISAYCYNYEIHAVMYRFANVIGARSTHGVIFDFINKLRANPKALEILGREPGTKKSYIHISDTVSAIIHGYEHSRERVGIYNIGTEDVTDVKTIADSVCKELKLKGVSYEWTGGIDDGRGWKGDVRVMLLKTAKIRALGWSPKLSSTEAVKRTCKELAKG